MICFLHSSSRDGTAIQSEPRCLQWESIFQRGRMVNPVVITVTGVNFAFDESKLAEGGVRFPRCKLGSLNIFQGVVVSSSTILCSLPDVIRQSSQETPFLPLEVSLNGRDFTNTLVRLQRYNLVNDFCSPYPLSIFPTIGSAGGGALVTVFGDRFGSGMLSVTTLTAQQTQLKSLLACGFGNYPLTPATLISQSQLVCLSPPHPLPETLPLKLSLNRQIVHTFAVPRFRYGRAEWVYPSSGPTEGGTTVSVMGTFLRPPPGNQTYMCMFGNVTVTAAWDSTSSCNPSTGKCYDGSLVCSAPPLLQFSALGVDFSARPISSAGGLVTSSSESSFFVSTLNGSRLLTGQAINAFDGQSDYKSWFSSPGMPQWLQYRFTQGSTGFRINVEPRQVVAGYSIKLSSGLVDLSEQVQHELFSVYDAPSSWQVLGSVDGETWQVLDDVKQEVSWTAGEEKVRRR